jgi:methylmalonyl-CoA/ethylmalonyl-CoA epimerase
MSVFEVLSTSPPAPRQATNEFLSGLGPIHLDHVGVAVEDVDRGMDRYSRLLGLDHWLVTRWESDTLWRGRQVRSGGIAAVANIGTLRVELAQPTIGHFTLSDWLARRGEGVFHIGYLVPDLPAALRAATASQWPIELISEDQLGPEYVYLDAESVCGVCIELIAERLFAGIPDANPGIRGGA